MSAPDAPTLPDRMPRERFIVAAPLLYNRKTPLRPDNKTLVSDSQTYFVRFCIMNVHKCGASCTRKPPIDHEASIDLTNTALSVDKVRQTSRSTATNCRAVLRRRLWRISRLDRTWKLAVQRCQAIVAEASSSELTSCAM
jgi:hypothetical protein